MTTEYLAARSEAITHLVYFEEVCDEYTRLIAQGGMTEAPAFLRTQALMYRDHMLNIQTDAIVASVINSEPELLCRFNRGITFWQWMVDNDFVEDMFCDGLPHQEASTRLPPDPDAEITGEAVLGYIRGLYDWLKVESVSLWGENNPLGLPEIGQRYAVGDFSQAFRISHILNEGVGLRVTWVQLASCGNYWETVGIGVARAKMLFKGRDILRSLVLPDAPPSAGNSGMISALLG